MVTLTRAQKRGLTVVVAPNEPKKRLPRKSATGETSTTSTRAPQTPVNETKSVQTSFAQPCGIEPVLQYSKNCASDKSYCNDAITDQMIEYCTNHIGKWSESEWQKVLEAIHSHLQSQDYSHMGMIHLIDLLTELDKQGFAKKLVLKLMVRLALPSRTNSDSPQTTMTSQHVIDSMCCGTPDRCCEFVLDMVDQIGVRECTGFVVDIVTKMMRLNSGIAFAECIGKFFGSNLSSVEAFFVIQISVVHLIRELMKTEDDTSTNHHKTTVVCMIGKFMSVFASIQDRFGGSLHTSLLPANLYPLKGKGSKDVKVCGIGDCVVGSCPPIPSKNLSYFLESNNLFECSFCKHVFRKSCDNCSSCPISDCCWGCGYRSVAFGTDHPGTKLGKSSNENLVALFLALSQLDSVEKKRFALTFALDVAKVALPFDKDELMRCLNHPVTESPPFAPSSAFTDEILFKLFYREKFSFLLDLVAKSFVSLLSTDPTTAGTVAKELKSVSKHISNVDSLSKHVLNQICESREVRCLNALLGFLETLTSIHHVHIPSDQIMELFYIHKSVATLNTKKLIVRVFVATTNITNTFETSNDMFIDYLCSELDHDWGDLFDEYIACLWQKSLQKTDNFGTVWSTVVPVILSNIFLRDRIGTALSSDQRYEIAMHFCRSRVYPECITYLLNFPHSTKPHLAESLIDELMNEILFADTVNVSYIESLLVLFKMVGACQPSPSHLKLYEQLRRQIFLSKQLGVVGACAKLLVVMTQAFDFSIDLITEVSRICLDTLRKSVDRIELELASVVRASMILANLVAESNVTKFDVTLVREWRDAVLAILPQVPISVSLSLVVALVSNPVLREETLAHIDLGFFESAYKNAQGPFLAALAAIVDSSITSRIDDLNRDLGKDTISTRPDQGVNCRSLAPLFPLVREAMLSSDSPITDICNAIRATRSFVTLGVVNPRTVPSVLMARYVLSANQSRDTSEFDQLLNTQDINMFAIRGMGPIESSMVRFVISNLLFEVLERVSSEGILSEIYRFVEVVFPSDSFGNRRIVPKDGSRFCLEYLAGQLVAEDRQLTHVQTLFVICALIVGCVWLGDDGSIVGRLSAALSISPEERQNQIKFVLSSLRHNSKEMVKDRFGFIADQIEKFANADVIEEDSEPVEISESCGYRNKKRDRQVSVGGKKGAKRQRISSTNRSQRECEEYTSGSSSSEHEDDN